MKRRYTITPALLVGLLCAATPSMRADESVTFQVDLGRYTNNAGAQAATLVDVRGAFNNWSGGSSLVNNGANVYTNTYTVVGTNAEKFQYKFTYTTCAGVTWEDNNPPPGAGQPPDEGNNRVLQLVGSAQTLPVVSLYAPSVTVPINLVGGNITYRVDLTEQVQLGNFIPPGDIIRVTGEPAALTAWGAGVDMTNNPALTGNASNIYSAVVAVCGAPGSSGGAHKFRMNNGWEDTENGFDRNFTFTGGEQVLPIHFYNDSPIGPLTNGTVTFQVDMSPQVLTGGFTNGVSQVTISGRINGWGTGEVLTNNPAASGNASNIYSGTVPLPPTATVGDWSRYKFRADGGWEAAAIYGVGNNNLDRRLYYTGGDQVLPLVTYNDASLCDYVLQATMVTFVLHITNGTLDVSGVPFDKANDRVYVSGEFLNWPWDPTSPTPPPEMTNNPVGSDFYQTTLLLKSGTSRRLQFKFGLNGPNHSSPQIDNENPFQRDHVQYIRNNNNPYTLATSEFGTNHFNVLVEPVFGNLKIGAPSGGNVPVTWMGYPCTTLQMRTSLTSGSWVDIPATDMRSSTNWPISGSQQYFRLQKRPLP